MQVPGTALIAMRSLNQIDRGARFAKYITTIPSTCYKDGRMDWDRQSPTYSNALLLFSTRLPNAIAQLDHSHVDFIDQDGPITGQCKRNPNIAVL